MSNLIKKVLESVKEKKIIIPFSKFDIEEIREISEEKGELIKEEKKKREIVIRELMEILLKFISSIDEETLKEIFIEELYLPRIQDIMDELLKLEKMKVELEIFSTELKNKLLVDIRKHIIWLRKQANEHYKAMQSAKTDEEREENREKYLQYLNQVEKHQKKQERKGIVEKIEYEISENLNFINHEIIRLKNTINKMIVISKLFLMNGYNFQQIWEFLKMIDVPSAIINYSIQEYTGENKFEISFMESSRISIHQFRAFIKKTDKRMIYFDPPKELNYFEDVGEAYFNIPELELHKEEFIEANNYILKDLIEYLGFKKNDKYNLTLIKTKKNLRIIKKRENYPKITKILKSVDKDIEIIPTEYLEKIEYSNIIILSLEQFEKFFYKDKESPFLIKFIVKDKKFSFKIGDDKEREINNVLFEKSDEDSASTYAYSFFHAFKKKLIPLLYENRIELRLKTDHPLRVSFDIEIEPRFIIKYVGYIAPRIEEVEFEEDEDEF